MLFWSSVELTGNQTFIGADIPSDMFWSSVELTGNQTAIHELLQFLGFGAVSN